MEFPIELCRNPQEMPPRIPQPRHRHGCPSGPWPFLDLDIEINPEHLVASRQPLSVPVQGPDWSRYPQLLFSNWTPVQQRKSGITKIVDRAPGDPCTVHYVNIRANGDFTPAASYTVTEDNKEAYWDKLQEEMPDDIRLRALFLDNLTGPVLQMLGTRYNIEPFFFTSSLNWIPARYQESVGEGDHITLTLTFIRSVKNPATAPSSLTSDGVPTVLPLQSAEQVIDTQAPLGLNSSNRILLPDIIALHMVRSPKLSTIISYHPPHTHRTTAASTLQARLLAAGQSVYWNKIFTSTIGSDPTMVLLALLWYPLYAFDESLEALYTHICWLESQVMGATDIKLTQQFHVVRAHLLHYASLLEDFRKSVAFVAETPNPLLVHLGTDDVVSVMELMRRESANLQNEIARLEQNRSMQDSRLKNVMELAFSSGALEDSRRMQKLTENAVRDSAAMKQISYLTMFFLPASFAASVFGMNVQEITSGTGETLVHYVAFALPLTAVTIWIIMAFQHKKDSNNLTTDEEQSFWHKISWPLGSLRKGLRYAGVVRAAPKTMSELNAGFASQQASRRYATLP